MVNLLMGLVFGLISYHFKVRIDSLEGDLREMGRTEDRLDALVRALDTETTRIAGVLEELQSDIINGTVDQESMDKLDVSITQLQKIGRKDDNGEPETGETPVEDDEPAQDEDVLSSGIPANPDEPVGSGLPEGDSTQSESGDGADKADGPGDTNSEAGKPGVATLDRSL